MITIQAFLCDLLLACITIFNKNIFDMVLSYLAFSSIAIVSYKCSEESGFLLGYVYVVC